MTRDELADLAGQQRDPETVRIYPLVADSGNRRVLEEWLTDHETYETVESDTDLSVDAFDLCIIDEEALAQYRDELEAVKTAAQPILLPVLLLLPETRTDVIDTDRGEIADNVIASTVDEMVSLPIRQTELEWRIRALVRLRAQSIESQRRTEQLRLFRQAIESSGHAVYITDTDGTIEYVNPAFEDLTGYTSEDVLGETPRILDSGEMSEDYFDSLWDTVLSGEVWREEIVNRRKDGDLYTATQTIAPVGENGEVDALVAVKTDITERKEREEILTRRTRAIEEAPVGIAITDPQQPDNPMIYVNEAFTEMTGYDREDAIGENCRFLQGEDTNPERVAEIRAAIDAQEPVSVDLRNYRKDGTQFWNRLEIAPVKDADGTVVNYIGFQQDITEMKRRQEQLGILDRILRHNLRNDMNVVHAQAERIRAEGSGTVAAAAESILAQSNELISMTEKEHRITELLQAKPRLETIDIGSVVDRVGSAIGSRYPEATIDIACPADVVVPASVEFERALVELVTNAVVHNDAPAPDVTVTVTTDDDTVRIDIEDDGPEIPEMERNVLIEDAEETPVYHGSGLGLWHVKLIVTRSNGTISVLETTAPGNTIRIELPAADA